MSFDRILYLPALMVLLTCGELVKGEQPTQREQEQITVAMQRNFEACNKEDIDLVMNSVADTMPGRDRFRAETVATFKQKDNIWYSLIECDVLDVRLPWAKARIVQDTLVLDRTSESSDQANYRNRSALLPQGERVEYINTFKRENGQWKLYLIISEMKPVKADVRPR